MKKKVKDRIRELGLTLNRPNRTQGKAHSLCVCGSTKRSHFNNAMGHNFKSGGEKNVV